MANENILANVEKCLELSHYSNFFVFIIVFVSVVFAIGFFVT